MKRYLIPALIFLALFISFGVSACMASYRFDVGCEGHLKRAGDANTVELASAELDTAIKYAEANGLTSGTTAIILPTPSEDIGFWYKNLVASREELAKLGPDASPLVRTNVLIKLRETLLDKSSSGETVTFPGGISQHPHEALYCLWGLGSFLAFLMVGGVWFWLNVIRDEDGPYPRRRKSPQSLMDALRR